MMSWGDSMLKFTGKPRANMYHDLTHSTIGFWTDNGGYYHYATGEQPCKPGDCPSYETVLPKVKACKYLLLQYLIHQLEIPDASTAKVIV